MKHFIFGSLVTATFIFLFVMPFVLFGECTLRWSHVCTPEEQLAHLDKWRSVVIKDMERGR